MRKIIEKIYHKIVGLLFSILGYFPKKNLFLFESFHGKQYSDNPRALYEHIREHYPEYHCIWAVKKGYEQPFIDSGVPFVRRLGWHWLLLMPRAQYWVFNTRMPPWMKKGKKTTYIQTWHGTPLKKLGLDIPSVKIPGSATDTYREEFIQEASRWDFLLSPNSYSTKIFRQAFGYEGRILESGYPRNDLLIDTKNKEKNIQRIKQKLGISKEKKVILYAPTWRDNQFYSKGAYRFENHFPFDELFHSEEDAVILVRLHYLIAEKLDLSQYGSSVIDCSLYEDVKELFLVTDLLITDYSSVLFDYALTDKPMIFYMYDFLKYKEETRGFYFDPQTVLPGPIIQNEAELAEAVQYFLAGGQIEYREKYTVFKQQFVHQPKTNASDEIMNEILNS